MLSLRARGALVLKRPLEIAHHHLQAGNLISGSGLDREPDLGFWVSGFELRASSFWFWNLSFGIRDSSFSGFERPLQVVHHHL